MVDSQWFRNRFLRIFARICYPSLWDSNIKNCRGVKIDTPDQTFSCKICGSPVIMYLAVEAKAQAKTLSSLGSSLTTESIFISGYNAVISVIPENKSSQDILCFFKREKNFGRFKTSFNSSSKAGVMQR